MLIASVFKQIHSWNVRESKLRALTKITSMPIKVTFCTKYKYISLHDAFTKYIVPQCVWAFERHRTFSLLPKNSMATVVFFQNCQNITDN